MAFKTRVISASTTPTVLASSTVAVDSTAALSLIPASLYDPVPLVIWSPSTQAVYFGGSSMTTATTALGIPMTGPNYFTYTLTGADPVFAITTNGTISLTVQAGRQS